MAQEDFFQDSTVVDVVQATIEKVDALEEAEQRKLLKVFRKTRRELQDRLLVIPEGTFSEQQLNVTLVQIQAAIETIKRDLKGQLGESSEILGLRGVEDLIREVEVFSKKFEGSVQPLNIEASVIALDSKQFLVNKFDASIDAYSAALRSDITTRLAQSLAIRDTTERTVSRMTSEVGKYFIGEEWKINRIARTELHNIYNYSKLNGMDEIQQDNVPDLKKALMHPIDNRTGDDSKALARQNPIVDINEPFVQVYKGRRFEFMFPPNRPNDRAILVPYRGEWGKQASRFSTEAS